LQSLQRNGVENTCFVAANFVPSLQKGIRIANKNALFGSATASLAVSLQTPNPTHAKTATKTNWRILHSVNGSPWFHSTYDADIG
jgi:hypothetical protein